MFDQNQISLEIENRQALIERIYRQIEPLEELINLNLCPFLIKTIKDDENVLMKA